MPKKFIQKYLPKHDVIKKQKSLAIFGTLLHNPNLWCLNRRSAAGAFAVGLFVAFIPLPSQMIIAAFLALAFGVNLPISVTLVWITNPITMPVIFYATYKLGTFLLNTPQYQFKFELSWTFLFQQMEIIGPPFLLGSLVCGAFFALLGYFGIHTIWRYSVVRSWEQRKLLRFPRFPRNKKQHNKADKK